MGWFSAFLKANLVMNLHHWILPGGPGRVLRDTGILAKNLKGYGIVCKYLKGYRILGSILGIWGYIAF